MVNILNQTRDMKNLHNFSISRQILMKYEYDTNIDARITQMQLNYKFPENTQAIV